ncbi:MAG: peptidylprolyl isomerase, partial [Boseongicola sp.]
WHVIRLNETRLKEAPALDQVRTELVDQLQRDAIDARVAELSGGADISRKTAADIDPALLDDISLLGE